MAEQNFERLARLARRAASVAQGGGQNPAIAAVGASVTGAANAFLAADQAVRVAGTAVARESAEAAVAIGALGQQYDTVRAVIRLQAPHEGVGPATSMCATPDDVLRYAEEAETVLVGHADASWAQGLVAAYQEAVDAATREWVQEVTARSAEQKARQERREAAAQLETLLVQFRRVVRSVYGHKAQEYHAIRSRGRNEPENPEEEAPEAGAPAPAPA